MLAGKPSLRRYLADGIHLVLQSEPPKRSEAVNHPVSFHLCSIFDSCCFKALRKITNIFKSCLEQVVPFQVQLNYFGKERV